MLLFAILSSLRLSAPVVGIHNFRMLLPTEQSQSYRPAPHVLQIHGSQKALPSFPPGTTLVAKPGCWETGFRHISLNMLISYLNEAHKQYSIRFNILPHL
jgi:hypothetical protein